MSCIPQQEQVIVSEAPTLTFFKLVPFLGCVLPLFLYDGEAGQVGPGLLRLPLEVELHVAFLCLLLLNLLSDQGGPCGHRGNIIKNSLHPP